MAENKKHPAVRLFKKNFEVQRTVMTLPIHLSVHVDGECVAVIEVNAHGKAVKIGAFTPLPDEDGGNKVVVEANSKV